MKKYLVLLTIFPFFSGIAVAQLSLRPQAGIQFSSLSYESVHGSVEGRAGYNVGLDLQIGGKLFVQPGINVNARNFEVADVGDVSLTKLNIPVMVGFKMFEPEGERAFGIRIFAGPNFAFNLNESVSDALTDIDPDDFEKFHLALAGGVGFDLSIFFVDLGYLYGLGDSLERDGASTNFNTFFANAGIRIGF